MASALEIRTLPRTTLSGAEYAELVALCTRAYGEDLGPYLAPLTDATHVLAYADSALVCHAAWVTRWLQVGDGPLLRTAYVEAVATEPAYERRGYATAVLRRLAEAIQTYDIGALSPSDPMFYRRLGWELWQGPLGVRTNQGQVPTPDEEAMILRLPNTLSLDFAAPLSIEWRVGEVW